MSHIISHDRLPATELMRVTSLWVSPCSSVTAVPDARTRTVGAEVYAMIDLLGDAGDARNDAEPERWESSTKRFAWE